MIKLLNLIHPNYFDIDAKIRVQYMVIKKI